MKRTSVILLILLLCVPALQAEQTPPGTQQALQNHEGVTLSRMETHDPAAGLVFQPERELPGPFELDEYGEQLWSDSDATGIMNSVAISDDGSVVAVGVSLNNQRLIVYDGDSGDTLYQFAGLTGEGYDVAVSGDGGYVGCANGQQYYLFTSESSDPVWTFDAGDGYRCHRSDINDDGSLIVIAGFAPTGEDLWVKAFDSESNTPLWTQTFSPDQTYGWYGVSISGDDNNVAVNGKMHAYLLDSSDGSTLWDFATNNTESPLGLSHDASVITCGSLSGGRVRVFHHDPAQETWILLWDYAFSGGSSNWASATAVSADGGTIAAGSLQFLTGGYAGYLAVFDTYSGPTPLWTPVNLGDMVADIEISDDGYTIAAGSWGDMNNAMDDILVFEKYSSEPFFSLNHPGSANAVAMNPDGTRLIAGGKGVHNRMFGNGGACYAIEADLEGGTISGTVTLTGEQNHAGVIVEMENGQRTTMTDSDGNYALHHVPAGTQTIVVHKLGWTTETDEYAISDGDVIEDADFTLTAVDDPPTGLTASQGQLSTIVLDWDAVTLLAQWRAEQDRLAATGDIEYVDTDPRVSRSVTRPLSEQHPPELDELDEADSIRVWRSSVSGGPYTPIATLDGDAATYTDEDDLFPTREYYYVVTAVFADGESDYSNQATGNLDDSYLVYDLDIPEMTADVTFDGVLEDGEWDDAVRVDVSDVFGYDNPDPPETAYLMLKYDDENDLLLVASEDYAATELADGVGIGFYVDDDASGSWSYDHSGSEGNYWAYYYQQGNSLRYRSLSGAPYNASPYYTFENPLLGFSDASGHVTCEFAIPLGFREEYEIALYGPDRSPGMAAFTLDRDNGNAVFTGWWPQNMASIVSNPEQFATCAIEADLYVPPAAPEDVSVSRPVEGENSIAIGWTDPTMGIDNLPIEDLAGVRIYRNTELIATVESGVEEFEDLTAVYGGWYEYSMAGYILDGDGEPFDGPMSAPTGIYVGEDPTVTEQVYDDDTWETFYIVGGTYEENHFGILFDTPDTQLDDYLDQQELYTVTLMTNNADNPIGIGFENNYYGAPIEVEVGPYWVTLPEAYEWYTFHFPGPSRPVLTTEDFWVILDWLPESPSSPGIATDTNGDNYMRSYWHNTSSGWTLLEAGNFMVRAGAGWSIFMEDGVEEDAARPYAFQLGKNYPNPFNPETVIPFELASTGDARLEVFNMLGQKVATLVSGPQRAGKHLAVWTGSDDAGRSVASGAYLLRLSSDGKTATQRIMLLK